MKGVMMKIGQMASYVDDGAKEIWPFAHGPASTPMGEAEAAWRARHQASAA
jgi:hypothetical protein